MAYEHVQKTKLPV